MKYKETFQIFSDGEKVLKQFTNKYVVHRRGFFLFAPSGTGKTYYINNQKKKDWIDGDEIWVDAKAQPDPSTEWWKYGIDVMDEIDQKSDIITMQARKQGLWIMGASCYWLAPDVVVLPDWKIHKQYIIKRENTNYDGGAKSSDFSQVLGHRKFIRMIARRHKVPVYKSIEEAVAYLKTL